MKPLLSSSTFNPFPPQPSLNPKRPSLSRKPPSIVFLNRQSMQTLKPKARPPFKNPEPPWFLPPPANLPARVPLLNSSLRVDSNGTAARVRTSIRLIQLRNLIAARPPPVHLDPIGRAVNSLACVMEELQKMVVHGMDEKNLVRISRETRDYVLWMFKEVFADSPNLIARLLGLVGGYLSLATVAEATSDSTARPFAPARSRSLAPMSWSDIGIIFETDNASPVEDQHLIYERKHAQYEQMIADDDSNSLILLNYAQFLYQCLKDMDRAEEFFSMTAEADPADAEAMNRFAVFLWKERGDLERAEEMFLLAVVADPDNPHYMSDYSFFVWSTGGVGTCVSINHDSVVCDDDQEVNELHEEEEDDDHGGDEGDEEHS